MWYIKNCPTPSINTTPRTGHNLLETQCATDYTEILFIVHELTISRGESEKDLFRSQPSIYTFILLLKTYRCCTCVTSPF